MLQSICCWSFTLPCTLKLINKFVVIRAVQSSPFSPSTEKRDSVATTVVLLQPETLSPFKRRVDHFSLALNSNLIGFHFCPRPMSPNLVNPICLCQ